MHYFMKFGLTVKEVVLLASLFVGVCVLTFGSRTLRLSSSALQFDQPVSIYLESSTDLDGLIDTLTSAPAEINEDEFRWASRLLGWRTFRAGHYKFEGAYSYDELLTKIAYGSQDPVNVTILPGLTRNRLARDLGRQLKLDSLDIEQVFEDSLYLNDKALSKEQLFGRMLPNTYSMYWTISASNVIDRVLTEFEDAVIEAYATEFSNLEYTVDDIVALASIVEWEANIEDEKPIIAGLYWNRLKKRMHLNADPTINFAVGERRRLLLKDYKVEHPYNTYIHYGLPPGPVTNPSLSTIRATLNPQDHDYIYMVASPEGGHVFNKTYQGHLADSEKWRKWIQEQYRIKRQREREATGG